jgi:hypothetical protein
LTYGFFSSVVRAIKNLKDSNYKDTELVKEKRSTNLFEITNSLGTGIAFKLSTSEINKDETGLKDMVQINDKKKIFKQRDIKISKRQKLLLTFKVDSYTTKFNLPVRTNGTFCYQVKKENAHKDNQYIVVTYTKDKKNKLCTKINFTTIAMIINTCGRNLFIH